MSRNTYNELTYKSNPFEYTFIEKMEAVATLYGLEPTNSKKARILELGSSFGGNILGQALYNPDNYYVGVDLSEEQVKIGNEVIEKLGLKNIELHQKNMLDIDESFGKFDYIVSHGVFSWVPDIVKDKMISICNENLNENGIAYISYNTYPGWREGMKIREMMMFANKYYQDESHPNKVARGKYVTKQFVDEIRNYGNTYELKKNYVNMIDGVLQKQDYYIGHEYLETVNDPMHLHEFVDIVEKYDLKYVSDMSLGLSFISFYPNSIKEKIEKLAVNNNVIKEQCLDFIIETNFRKSLLCKKSQENKLNFSESIPNVLIDKYYFEFLYSLKELNQIIEANYSELSEIIPNFYGKSFTVGEVINFYKEKSQANEEKKEEVTRKLRSFLLNSMLSGKVYYSLNRRKEKISFEENKVFIPEKIVNYVDLLFNEYSEYIGIANFRNETIFLLDVEVDVIKALKEPTTKKEILEKIEKYIIRREINGEIIVLDKAQWLDKTLNKFTEMNLFEV